MTENDAISELEKFQIQVEHSIAEEERCEYDNLEKALQEDKEFLEAFDMAISALKEVQQYRAIGTVEECRKAVDKLTKAEKTLSSILSGNYNDECNFCVHNDNPMANCNCLSGDGSWCMHNAKWNGKTSDTDDLEGMDNGA